MDHASLRLFADRYPAWVARVSATGRDGMPTVQLTSPQVLVPLLRTCRDHLLGGYEQLIDITAVDLPEQTHRFHVVYHLLSLRTNRRLRLRLAVQDTTPVPSATAVYPSAGWYEREVWDMFGVVFTGHPDLRRLLTDYGFQGHPLRKDFPLSGYTEVRYSESDKRVITTPLELPQEYRSFALGSPWDTLPQDTPEDIAHSPANRASDRR